MSTTINEAETGMTPKLAEAGVKAVTQAKEYTWGWAKLAQFLADNPDIADTAHVFSDKAMVYLSPADDAVSRLADYTRRGMRAGARVEKSYDDNYGKVLLHFGPVHLQVYSHRDEVCERVVIGTREVVEEVKDPEALAAVPTITQTRTEDIIRWECKPLLAGEQNSEVSA
jgi:hypothetical protein